MMTIAECKAMIAILEQDRQRYEASVDELVSYVQVCRKHLLSIDTQLREYKQYIYAMHIVERVNTVYRSSVHNLKGIPTHATH